MTIDQKRDFFRFVRRCFAASLYNCETAGAPREQEAHRGFINTCHDVIKCCGIQRNANGYARAAQLLMVWMDSGDLRSDWRRYHQQTPALEGT